MYSNALGRSARASYQRANRPGHLPSAHISAQDRTLAPALRRRTTRAAATPIPTAHRTTTTATPPNRESSSRHRHSEATQASAKAGAVHPNRCLQSLKSFIF
jgi:hypothetical protein